MSKTTNYYELATDVELLYTKYCETLDSGEIERWPDFFPEKCLYRITTRENLERNMPLSFVLCDGSAMLRDRAVALQKTVFYRTRYQRRIISGIRLKTFEDIDDKGIETCASFVIFESIGDNPTQLLVCGHSSDVIIREEKTLKFKQRVCIIDARIIPDSLVFPI